MKISQDTMYWDFPRYFAIEMQIKWKTFHHFRIICIHLLLLCIILLFILFFLRIAHAQCTCCLLSFISLLFVLSSYVPAIWQCNYLTIKTGLECIVFGGRFVYNFFLLAIFDVTFIPIFYSESFLFFLYIRLTSFFLCFCFCFLQLFFVCFIFLHLLCTHALQLDLLQCKMHTLRLRRKKRICTKTLKLRSQWRNEEERCLEAYGIKRNNTQNI